jgi:hypothetical protein
VIVKTIGVTIIPFGAKKCPMNPFKITVNVASAILLFIFFCRLYRHSLTANGWQLTADGPNASTLRENRLSNIEKFRPRTTSGHL